MTSRRRFGFMAGDSNGLGHRIVFHEEEFFVIDRTNNCVAFSGSFAECRDFVCKIEAGRYQGVIIEKRGG